MGEGSGADPRCAEQRFDAIVLGAGVSGLVAASVLARQGCGRVLVVDEYARLGGNHISWQAGPYTFDVGSLIFQDDSPFLRHFPELLPHYTPISPSWSRLNPQGRVTKYPISVRDDLLRAGPLEWAWIAGSIVFSRLFRRRLANAHDYAQYWIGRRFLQRSGLHQYMARFYGLPPEEIELGFAEKRMAWVRQRAELRDYVRRWLRPEPWEAIPSQPLARPPEGFDALYRRAAERLNGEGVSFQLGAKLRRLTRGAGGGFTLESDGGRFAAPRVISTIPIPRAQALAGLPPAQDLKSVTLMSLFFSFAGRRGFATSVLYNFSPTGAWKRLTMHSDFYGPREEREYFTVEVNAEHVGGDLRAAEADFRAHAAANGLFQGDLELEGSHALANAYPVYAHGAAERVAEATAMLHAFGIVTLGRQGRFEYQPTARVSTLDAEAALSFRW